MKGVGGRADSRQVCKENSQTGRLWGARKTVRRKINDVGESGLQTDPQRKEQKWEVIRYRKEGRRKMYDIRGGSGLLTDLQRKEQK